MRMNRFFTRVLFVYMLLVWLVLFLVRLSAPKVFVEKELYFKSPEYLVQYPNFTIGSLFEFVTRSGTINQLGVSEAISMYCALKNYETGRGKYPVKGIFNLFGVVVEAPLDDQVNAMITRLEGQDLFYFKNGSQFGSVPDSPIGTIFFSSRLDEVYYLHAPLAFFPIPSLAQTFADQSDDTESFQSDVEAPDYGLQLATGPVAVLLSRAIGELMAAFGWYYIGLMYSNDPYGSAGLSVALDILAFTNRIDIQCMGMVGNSSTVSKFSSCIKRSSVTRVISLWMPLAQAATVAQQIIDETGLEQELVFIIPYVKQTIIGKNVFPVMTFFFSSIIFGANPIFDEQCSEYITEVKQKTGVEILPPNLLDEFYKNHYLCSRQDKSLALCPDTILEREVPCRCTGKEPITNSYVIEGVDTVMLAIYYMQNNCSYLTERSAFLFRNTTLPVPTPDFCSLTTFNTFDMAIALKTVEIGGLVSDTPFNRLSSVRTDIELTLFQFQPERIVQLGKFIRFNLTINTSKAFFYSPPIISKEVPDNPSIDNDAVAAVGFGVDIALMVLTVSIMIFLLLKMNHPIIRKSSPIFSLLILLGIFFIELSFMFYCFSLTAVICRLDDWFLITGMALIIANLLAKDYRIYKIFNNSSAQAVRVSLWVLLSFSFVILPATWVLMILYETLGGGLQAKVIESDSDRFYSYVLCEVENDTIQLIFLITFYVYFILLFLVAAIFAFLNRKVSSLYGESKEVALVVYSWIGLAILYAPIYYVQGGSTDSNRVRFALRFIATLLACLLTLLFLFFQKIKLVIIDELRKRE